MTAENEREINQRCVEAFLEGLTAMDLEAIGACLSDDAVWEQPFTGTGTPTVITGKRAILAIINDIATQRRGVRIINLLCTPMLAPGSFLTEWRGTWDMISGPAITLDYATLFWLRGRKVARIREYYDTAAFAKGVSTR